MAGSSAQASRLAQCWAHWARASHTLEADYNFTETLAEGYRLTSQYRGEAEFPSARDWKIRQRFLGNRSFRGSYKEEKDLRRDFVLAYEALRKNPEDREAHHRIVELAGSYLSKTGVPNEIVPRVDGTFSVSVTPLLPKRWREWARENFGGGAGAVPQLTILSQQAKLRGSRLIFSSRDLAKEHGGTFYDQQWEISLGVGELFGNQREGTYIHEASHDEHEAKSDLPWTKELARSDTKGKAWLPQVRVKNGQDQGVFKGTSYEENYFAEEIECCLREAAEAYHTASRLKHIAAQNHHPDAEKLMRTQINYGRDRLDWVMKFSAKTQEALTSALSSQEPLWSESTPGKIELSLANGKSVELTAAQFPATPGAEASAKARANFLSLKLGEIGEVVEALRVDGVELDKAFETEFPKEP